MRARDAAEIAVSVVGLLAFVFAIGLLSGIAWTIQVAADSWAQRALVISAYVLPFAFLMVLSGYLLRNAGTLAARTFPDGSEDAGPVRADDLERLAFSVLGLWLVLTHVPGLLAIGGQVAAYAMGTRPPSGTVLLDTLGTLLDVAAGVALFYRGSEIVRWLRRVDRSRKVRERPSCPSCGQAFDPADYRADATERLCVRCRSPLPEALFPGAAAEGSGSAV